MDILPAIDILGGKAVRLAKGDYNAVTVYNDDPAAQAALFKEQGARWIHVVDLDGARSGVPENIDIIERIIKETGLKIEVGGGIRSLETIDRLAEAGVSRVVLGTVVQRIPDQTETAYLAPVWIVQMTTEKEIGYHADPTILMVNAIDGSFVRSY